MRFVSPDGEVRAVLLEDPLRERERINQVLVSPDGSRVSIMLWKDVAPPGFIHSGGGAWPASHTLFAFDLASGRTIIREEFNYEWNGRVAASAFSATWNQDGTLPGVVEHAYPDVLFAGFVSMERGVFLDAPAGVTSPRQVSPGFDNAASENCSRGRCSSLEIAEFETGRVLHGLDYFGLTDGRRDWTWVSADQFAWSSGQRPDLFDFHHSRLIEGAEQAEISILTISTGDVEVIDSTEYVARFAAQPASPAAEARASVQCPDDRGQPCPVLFDGEAVAEGRWANVIGFIEVD